MVGRPVRGSVSPLVSAAAALRRSCRALTSGNVLLAHRGTVASHQTEAAASSRARHNSRPAR
jgi:hypothetical protein